MQISIKADFNQALRRLSNQQKQVAFATAVALTKTAKDIEAAEYKEMRDVFDRPTPYTMNSLYVRRATRTNLKVMVGVKDSTFKSRNPEQYLSPQIKGGARNLKAFERALRGVGVLPNGYYAVPGSAAKLDAYGNMARGQIVQLISYFGGFAESGSKANMTSKSKINFERKQGRSVGAGRAQFFVGSPADGKLPFGIWQRFNFATGTSIKPVLLFVRGVNYQKNYDFTFVAESTFKRNWRVNFDKALADAIRTAR